MKRPRWHVGFTLVELLIALTIVALLSILAWRGLQEVLNATRRLESIDTQLQITQAVFDQWQDDLQHLHLSRIGPTSTPDRFEAVPNGVRLLTTWYPPQAPAFQTYITWTLQQGQLVRSTQRLAFGAGFNSGLGSNVASNNAPSAVTGDPIPMHGLAIRVWQEPGGWSNPPLQYGHTADLGTLRFDVQGAPNPLEPSNTGGAPDAWIAGDSPKIRAIEVTLTQTDGQQAFRQVFVTGGVQ